MQGFFDNKAVLGDRYKRVGISTVQLRPYQLEVRDNLLGKFSSGEYPVENAECLCHINIDDTDITLTTVDRYGLPNRVVICTNCGLLRTTPRLSGAAYADFYQTSYRKLYSKIEGTPEEVFDWFVSRQGRAVSHWLNNLLELADKNVLEIGCGGGWNLLPLRQYGCTVVGYDYDPMYLQVGRNLGLSLHQGGISEALAASDCYDLIILSHVVEHFLDPVQDLQNVARLLNPTGLVYIEVPGLLRNHTNQQDLMAYWQNAHTYYFTLVTLSNLMSQTGYQMVMGDEFIHSLWQVSQEENRNASWIPNSEFADFLLKHLIECEKRHQLTVAQHQPSLITPWPQKVFRRIKRGLGL